MEAMTRDAGVLQDAPASLGYCPAIERRADRARENEIIHLVQAPSQWTVAAIHFEPHKLRSFPRSGVQTA